MDFSSNTVHHKAIVVGLYLTKWSESKVWLPVANNHPHPQK